MKHTWTHKVVKEQRGQDGEWFRYPTCHTGFESDCHEYAKQFAHQQTGVGGTRIAVYTRNMKRTWKYYVQ